MRTTARLLAILPGLVLLLLLSLRLAELARLSDSMEAALLRAREAGLFGHVRGSGAGAWAGGAAKPVMPGKPGGAFLERNARAVGRAMARYAAAVAMLPRREDIGLSWVESSIFGRRSGPRLDEAKECEIEGLLEKYDQALQIAEWGASTDYHPARGGFGPSSRGKEGRLRLEAGLYDPVRSGPVAAGSPAAGACPAPVGLAGRHETLQALLRARALYHLHGGASNHALASLTVALRSLDHLAVYGGLGAQATRFRLMAQSAELASLVMEEGRPGDEQCRVFLAAFERTPFWQVFVPALRAHARSRLSASASFGPAAARRGGCPGRLTSFVSRFLPGGLVEWYRLPWKLAGDASFLLRCAAASRALTAVASSAAEGRAWAAVMKRLAGTAPRGWTGGAVEARLALSLAAARAAFLVLERKGSGIDTVDAIPEGLVDKSMLTDPWSPSYLHTTRKGGRLLVYSVGPDGRDDGGAEPADVVHVRIPGAPCTDPLDSAR